MESSGNQAGDVGEVENGTGHKDEYDFSASDPGPSFRPGTSTVTPGVKDSEGFLTPPPASTLLIRRTRTNSTGSSTYVVASPQGSSGTFTSPSISQPQSSLEMESLPSSLSLPPDIRKSFSVPYRRLHKRSSRDRRGESYKRMSLSHSKVNVLLTPQQGSHVQVNVPSGNGIHHRSSFPPISPLALDPSHALSVTLSADRSISTVVPIDSLNASSSPHPFVFPPISQPSDSNTGTNGSVRAVDEDKSQASRGKPAAFMANESQVQAQSGFTFSGKGMPSGRPSTSGKQIKRKRGERGPDRFPNIDPSTGKRRYVRKKRFTLDRRPSYRGSRLQGRSHSGEDFRYNYDHEMAGKWRPTDDLRLIINVLQLNDLELVHRGVRFSCKFTLENIERRWAGLLYNKAVSKVALNSIQNIHPRIVAFIYETALFSAEEDRILKTVRSTNDPKTVKPVMEKLLKENALVFLKWRTVKSLIEHWLLLREYHLLCDQNVQDYFDQESFSEFEENLTEQEVREYSEMDPNVRREIQIANRNARKMIRTLEEEVSRWQVLGDMVTELEQAPFEEGSYAMLRGKQVRYLMRSREITLGRRTPTSLNVDADLSMEGSTYKVSRTQAMIQLRTLGDFLIANHGKHAIYVDGNAIMPKKVGPLEDQSVIEISQLRFVFMINHKLVAEQRKKWIKLEVKKEMNRLSKIARFIKAHPAYPIVHPSHPLNSSGGSETRTNSDPLFSNNASATIDSVATNAVGPDTPSSSSAVMVRPPFTGSLTRPPQPPKYSASSSTSTTFIRSFIPPPTTLVHTLPTSSPIPRISSVPLFRKPLPPPSNSTAVPTSERFGTTSAPTSVISVAPPSYLSHLNSVPSGSNRTSKGPNSVAIQSLRPPSTIPSLIAPPIPSTSSIPVSVISAPPPKREGDVSTRPQSLPLTPYTSPFPATPAATIGQRSPTVLITPSSQAVAQAQSAGALSDLIIRPGQPPKNTSSPSVDS